MPLLALPAVFMRGGTSRAIMFHARDLPEREAWDGIFLGAMGSPDPNGRQLNGMGGGVSSLSKVCVLAPSAREDADVDYTFAQVQIREAAVDYRGNCGNMSSAVGPFAVDEGIVRPNGDTAIVRIFNTNTRKIIRSTFPLTEGRAATEGALAIPGVAGTGAPVRLDFLSPGGATTGRLLPTGQATDRLDVPGAGAIDVSMVDAANACVFVRAADLGLSGKELPDQLDTDKAVLERLQVVRRAASVAMGIAAGDAEARTINAVPIVGFVAPPMDAPTLSGDALRADQVDLTVRFISNGQPHRALPLTASLCTAVAARIAGTVVH
ncbi:MAG TPA: PrpF domain-containing protein, partial [Acetobacteraceae bacterium]